VQVRDGMFATVAAGGRYIAQPIELGVAGSGWVVDSIVAGDKDITDRPFDLQSDLTSLIITFTDRPSTVTGVIRNARGEISPTAMAVAFPIDPERWTDYGPEPRLLQSAVAGRDGAYTFKHLPAGEYYVVAIDAAESGWRDPRTLEALAGQAQRITTERAQTGPKTLDLTLKAVR